MKRYSIGLDIGTSSVGWAVIDEDNRLVRYKKKNMWGMRLFDEAKKAEERRGFRSYRRRLNRRRQRINFLQNLLSPIVLAADDLFFIKMNESMLHDEDKNKDPLSLSLKEAGYYDKNDSNKLIYPTIYHLRKDLINNPDKKDPRLVYLALHHIIKYRGNFLYAGQKLEIDDSKNITSQLEAIFYYLEDNYAFSGQELLNKQDEIIKILIQYSQNKSSRRSEILALFNFSKEQNNIFKQVISAFLGLSVDLSKFNDASKSDNFDFSTYEEKRTDIEEKIGERIELFDLMQSVYSWVLLQDSLRGESSISQAMIRKYDDYAKDLAFIKRFFKHQLSRDEYKTFFKSKQDEKSGAYSHYAKYSNEGWNYDEFIKDLKSASKSPKNLEVAIEKFATQFKDKDAARFIKRLNQKEAFSKLRMNHNGAIPYQLHKNELVKIIENQGKYYPELLEKIDNGDGKQTYKIVRLLEHKVPYYVGPLTNFNQKNSDFSWAIRREKGDITPFNFYQKVDKMASAEQFINQLTNNCTYLPTETVLPKNSLLFSEFVVRNEIKNIRINDKRPSGEVIDAIFEQLFLIKKKVTKKDVVKLLENNHFPSLLNQPKIEITGLASESHFNSSMASYIDFVKILETNFALDIYSPTYEMIENIIKWVVVFEDKDMLREKIRKEYPDTMVNNIQLDLIVRLRYSGWANLSRALFTTVKDSADATILDLMREDEDNFMQIISRKDLKRKLDNIMADYLNQKELNDYDSLVGDLPGSPGIKRGIWQAKLLVDEIIHLNNNQKPHKIYIEMAKGADKNKKRTVRRIDQIKEIYKNIDTSDKYCQPSELKQMNNDFNNFEAIDQDSYFLYFRQMGKCAYSGIPLDLNSISQTCEVEHIIPQSLIKDNSLDNKVLVLKKDNQDKKDRYPIDADIVKSQIGLWKYWLNNKLISDKKFYNLTKTKQQFEKDKASGGFIMRQLVETRQITKRVAGLFEELYRTDESVAVVEPVKAGVVSNFRDKFNFPKSRIINDFHHAKDAYLTAVIGRFLSSQFPERSRRVLYERYMKSKDRAEREDRESSFVLFGIDAKDNINTENGEVTDGGERMDIVGKTMRYNDCLATRLLIERKGQFYGANLSKAKPGLAARKNNLSPELYGGYSGIEKAYYVAVSYVSRNKRHRKIMDVPIKSAYQIRQKILSLDDFVKTILPHDATDIKILINKIMKYQTVLRDGSMQMVVSSNEAWNAKQLFLDFNLENIFCIVESNVSNENILIKKIKRFVDEKLSDADIINLINQKLNEFFDEFVRKLNTEYRLFKNVTKQIESEAETFRNLDYKSKVAVLRELLKLTQVNPEYPNFKTHNFGSIKVDRMGRLSNATQEIQFLYSYSITGLKVKKVRLT